MSQQQQQQRHLAAHGSCSGHEKTLLCSSNTIKSGTNFWIFIFSKQHHFFLSYYLFHSDEEFCGSTGRRAAALQGMSVACVL